MSADVERLADMVTAACGASMPQPSYRLYEPKVRASFIERYRRAAGGEAMTTDAIRAAALDEARAAVHQVIADWVKEGPDPGPLDTLIDAAIDALREVADKA